MVIARPVVIIALVTSSLLASDHPAPRLRPFDEAQSLLPVGYSGASIVGVFKLYEIRKGEFETSADFERRRNALPSDVFAFRVPHVDIQYDADEGEVRISKFADSATYGWLNQSSSGAAWILSDTRTTLFRAPGQNSYGATTMMSYADREVYGITESDSRQFIEVRIPMSPARAKAIMPHLNLIIIVAFGPESAPSLITDPGNPEMNHATGFELSDATIASPSKLSTYYHVLRGQCRAFWIFDATTGEVIARLRADGSIQ